MEENLGTPDLSDAVAGDQVIVKVGMTPPPSTRLLSLARPAIRVGRRRSDAIQLKTRVNNASNAGYHATSRPSA
jgi:hypothetical protein